MRTKKTWVSRIWIFMLSATLIYGLLSSCSDDSDDDDGAEAAAAQDEGTGKETIDQIIAAMSGELKTVAEAYPKTYEFKNASEESTVSYTGQTFRQVLISDLKAYLNGLKQGGSSLNAADLNTVMLSYFEYNSGNTSDVQGVIKGTSTFGVSAELVKGVEAEIAEGTTYDNLQESGKNLSGKIAGKDNDLLRTPLKGWSAKVAETSVTTPTELVKAWMGVVASQAASGAQTSFTVANGDQGDQTIDGAYLTTEGLDLTQLIEKFLHVSVSFSQTAQDYLGVDLGEGKGLLADNTAAKEGKTYTALEHHWDEGFGYFGAARDYLSYTDDQVKSGLSKDSDSDTKVDMKSEKNFGISVNLAKRDVGSTTGTDLSTQGMKAFLVGRHLIAEKPEGYLDAVKKISIAIKQNWEKALAATVVHYINDVIKDMGKYGMADYSFATHAKHWAEMKGFALGFQFNPHSLVDNDTFDKLHEHFGDAPVLGREGTTKTDEYIVKLKSARDLLKTAFSFDTQDVEKW